MSPAHEIPDVPPSAGEAAAPDDGWRPPPLCLGDLQISPPSVLAPMSGLTNLPLRTLCEEQGCGLTVTEFLAAPALAAGVPKELQKLQPSLGGRPFGVQIFGRDPGQMARAAQLAAERGAALVDLNMGCPARKVTKGMAGAALMREPRLAVQLVQAVAQAVAGRCLVTVKMRAGWDADHLTAPDLARAVVQAGAGAVTVHGRTAKQGFSGRADLQRIAEVVRAVPVPVIGNGDVTGPASMARMFSETGCAGVMIGRAALGNPWIFAACAAWWRQEDPPAPPTVAQQVQTYLRHLDLYLQIAPERRAVVEMRKFAGWYMRGFAGAVALRQEIYHTEDLSQIRELVRQVAT